MKSLEVSIDMNELFIYKFMNWISKDLLEETPKFFIMDIFSIRIDFLFE